jgi:hypothetical protein
MRLAQVDAVNGQDGRVLRMQENAAVHPAAIRARRAVGCDDCGSEAVKGYCKRGHLIEGVRPDNGRRYCLVCKRNWRRLKKRLPRELTDAKLTELAVILANQYFLPRPAPLLLDRR